MKRSPLRLVIVAVIAAAAALIFASVTRAAPPAGGLPAAEPQSLSSVVQPILGNLIPVILQLVFVVLTYLLGGSHAAPGAPPQPLLKRDGDGFEN